MNTRTALACLICALLSGLICAYLGYQYAKGNFNSLIAASHAIREGQTEHHLINPLLACELPQDKGLDEYSQLEQKVNNLIQEEKDNNATGNVSVYLIRSGRWVGINENAQYEPASMLKVVLMIAYFKDSETRSGLLSTKLLYTEGMKDTAAGIPYQATSSLAVGNSYRVDELIDKMIIESDNVAMNILLSGVNESALADVYTDLGIEGPDNATSTYTISAKSYSLFFRILYNATYLDQKDSEHALELLSKTKFDDGLVAGVPKGTLVSHKYGERVTAFPGGLISGVELHDCGFIYPKGEAKPYFLCVMTKGGTQSSAQKIISDISSFVYGQLVK